MSKEEWRMGYADEDGKRGCNVGCDLLIVAALAVDALAAFAIWSMADFFGWLLSLMAAV